MPLFVALWDLVKRGQRRRLFTTVWFSHAPPGPTLPVQFKDSERVPIWLTQWKDIESANRVRWLGKQLMDTLQSSNAGQSSMNFATIDLTDAVIMGPWFRPIIESIRPTSTRDAKKLILLADRGNSHGPIHPVSSELHAAIIQVIEYGENNLSDRPAVADLLQQRLGPIFGQNSGGGWTAPTIGHLTPLPLLHQQVRSWLMGQVLDILFTHLAPKDGPFVHQVQPRHDFWRNPLFVSRMRKVYILAGPEFDNAIRSPDITDLLRRFPGAIARRKMKGTDNQAILWMHWTAANGQTWTIIEGNLNCKVRIRRGIYEPPRLFQAGQLLPVEYSPAIVNGDLGDNRPHHDSTHRITSDDHVFRKPHNGQNWAPETLEFLTNNRIVE
jgi:hypothetical protein